MTANWRCQSKQKPAKLTAWRIKFCHVNYCGASSWCTYECCGVWVGAIESAVSLASRAGINRGYIS